MRLLARLVANFLADLEAFRVQRLLKKKQAALEDAKDWLSFYRRGVVTYERKVRECAEELAAHESPADVARRCGAL